MSATSVAGPQELLLQLLDPANRANPYAVYEQFRAARPDAYAGQQPHRFLVLPRLRRGAAASGVVGRPAEVDDGQKLAADGAKARPQGPPMFLFLDPPDHTRLRKLVSKAFVPKVVNELTPHITELVDGMLDRVAEQAASTSSTTWRIRCR